MSDKQTSQTEHKGDKQSPAKKAVAVAQQPQPEQKSGAGGTIATLALVTALGAAGLGYKSWEESNKLNQKLADQGGMIETSINSALKPAIDSVGAVESGLGSVRTDIGSVQSNLDALQSEISSLKSELASLQSGLGEVQGGVETLESSQQSEIGDINANLDEKIQDVKSLQGSLEEQQKSLQDNVTALNEGLTTLKSEVKAEAEKDNMSAWVLAEVEYLLTIANSRLQLEHDVDAALTALNAATQKLTELNLADLADVQQMISDEIEALSALPKLNIANMAKTLSTIGSSIEGLPLAQPKEAALISGKSADSEREKWEVLADEVWTALRPLVAVRNSQDPAMAPLTPEKHTYLTQNLQMKIEAARLALLRADNTVYHENLALANEWVSKFYDTASAEGSSLLNTLDELQQATLDSEKPDISASLNALQQYIASKSLKVSAPHSGTDLNNMLALSSPNNAISGVKIH